MSIMLGEAHAKISLDISGLKSGASQAASILRGLDGLGSGAFGGMEKALKDLESSLAHVGKNQVDIDVTAAIGGTKQLAVAIEDVEAKIEAASGSSLTIDAAEATGALQQVALAVDDVSAKLAGSGGTVFGLNTSEAVAGLAQVRAEAQDAVAAIRAAGGVSLDVNASQAIASLTQVASATDEVMAQLAAADNATIAISVTRDQLDAASRAVQELRATVGQSMTATVSIAGLGELDAATTQAVRTREAIGGIADAAPSISLGNLTGDLNQAVGLANQLTSSLSGLGSIGLGAGIAGLLIAPLVQGIQTAAQLEQSLKNVEVALGNVSNTDLGRLDASIREIGSATEYSAKQIAEVAESLAKAGYDVSDMIDGQMLPAVANLASATGSDLQTAVTGIVQAMAMWSPAIVDTSIAMTDASRAADILTVAANSSSADIQDIIAGMRNLGPVVSQMGVGFDEAAASISIFTNYGLKGADAGISLARGLQNLNEPTSEAAQLMDQLGISVFDAQGNFVGMEQLFGQLSNAMRNMTEQQRFTTISLLFGAEAADAYALAVSMGVDPLVAAVQAMQQQGIAADQASRKTDTLKGAWDRLNEATTTALGGLAKGAVGPLTMLATVVDGIVSAFGGLPSAILQPIGLIAGFGGAILALVTTVNLANATLGMLGTSFTRLTGISAAAGAIRSVVSALMELRAVGAVLAALSGPLGILLGVVSIIGGSLVLSWLKSREAAKQAAAEYKAYADAVDTNNKRISDTLQSGNLILAQHMQTSYDLVHNGIKRVEDVFRTGGEGWQAINLAEPDRMPDLTAVYFDTAFGRKALNYAKNTGQISDYVFDVVANGSKDAYSKLSIEDRAAVADAVSGYITQFTPTDPQKKAVEDKIGEIWKLYEDPNIDPTKIDNAVAEVMNTYANSDTPSIDWLLGNKGDGFDFTGQGLASVIAQFGTVGGAAANAQKQIAQVGDSWTAMAANLRLDGNKEMATNLESMTKNFEAVQKGLSKNNAATYTDDLQTLFGAMKSGKVDVEKMMSGFAELDRQFANNQITAEQYANGVHQMVLNIDDYAVAAGKAVRSTEEIAAAQKQVAGEWLKATGNDDFVSQLNMAGLGTTYSQLAGDITDANTALGDGMRIVVGNTNALGQNAQAAQDWADELIKAPGVYSKLDDMLAKGTVTQTQYNAAQQAQVDIAADNAAIQEDILTIQAKQAPMIATSVAALQDYVETLSTLPPEQQAVALGWLDANEATKANQIVAMAAAAANGELGESGKIATEKMIQGAVAADPYLKAMLLDMGLISEGADGTITVNFEGAASTQATLDDLNSTLLTIADLLDNGKLDGSINITVKGIEQAEAARAELEKLQDKKITVTIAMGGATTDSDRRTSGIDGPFNGGLAPITIPANADITSVTPPADPTKVAAVAEVTDVKPPAAPIVLPAEIKLGPVTGPAVPPGVLSGGAAPSSSDVNVTATVIGGEQVEALQKAIDALKDKPVTVTATVTGAELIGAIKLDVQNLSNKNILVMVSVEGADAIGTLKSDVEDLENKTLVITGDNTDALIKWNTVQGLPDATKWLFFFGDNTDALVKWNTVQGLPDATKWLFIFGDNGDAMEKWQAVQDLTDITKTLTINVVVNGDRRVALATGGTVPGFGGSTTVARMAELGPELFRTPSGKWGMAMTDGLYPMIPGTYVFTAAQSRRMWEHWTGQSYARGGRVRRDTPTRGERSRYSGGGGSTVITVHSRPNITVNPQSRVTQDDLTFIMTEVADATVSAVQNARDAKGGAQ